MDFVVKQVLEKSGFSKLNPVQEEALKAGVLEGENLVLAAPTASGKTLVAEFAALNAIKEGRKVVYIVPLRALASEKYHEFKEKYEPLGIRIALSIGDLDSSDHWLARFDLIIVTSEKFDSLLRHGIPWIDQIGLVVADEIHLLNDPGRGPTLEVTLTKLKSMINPQILALSATIRNYEEIAEWLGAKAIRSDYRPVKLYRGVCFDREIHYEPKKKTKE
ncbi:MAG: DEAD/DEAH box helicase, partial [Candidatus Aenigmarchaeota archaeon]|nr:DEAD/DEAH box helicase [Candidatus Aenigmarchaeota archaeon]